MSLIFYHGSPNEFVELDPCRAADGVAQEGPGFYLTSHRYDAQHYAGLDGHVMRFDVDSSSFINAESPIDEDEIEELVLKSPELHHFLSNWCEIPEEAYEEDYKLPESTSERKDFFCHAHLEPLKATLAGDTLKDVLESVWYECYRNSPAEFLKNITELGYTGFLVPKADDVVHAIVFDKDALELLDIEPAYASSPSSKKITQHGIKLHDQISSKHKYQTYPV